MKKRIIVITVIVLVISMLCLSGCDLFGDPTDNVETATNKSTTLTKDDLETELSKYRELVEAYQSALQEVISGSKSSIGAYATVYTDSLLNITCTEGNSSVQGTGFIITTDGYVLTNNHVVTYTSEVINEDDFRGINRWGQRVYGTKIVYNVYTSVKAAFDEFSPNSVTTYTLEVVYNDPDYDLALCRIKETAPTDGWKPIPFYAYDEDSAPSRGNELLVLGNARGFGLSATSGLISATGKTFSDYPKITFIQTDAAINGGNSGGPAINIYGGLVGVVNSKFVSVIKSSYFSSEIEDVEGMGFAIELECVKTFIRMAEESKGVTVRYQTVSASGQAISAS